jgi:hypothetical protein
MDRRRVECTTCHVPLPEEFLLTSKQTEELAVGDQHARAEHSAAMGQLDESNEPDSTVDMTGL